ncbi:hypothetical protein [Bacillus cereus]|uniref:hypothetical protein n=1 Tax=Bacillus cereus TaxID=1396 RepID=UPI0018CE2EDB|nr:hypothetical protein [Bacillus cereus]MBG9716493.1 hypothetical protein [Bacillus cereus]
MNISLEKHFKRQVFGAVNSYIRIINEYEEENKQGKGVIKNEWKCHLEDDGNTFVATLIIEGKEEKIYFQKNEWKSIHVNMLANVQLQALLKRFI